MSIRNDIDTYLSRLESDLADNGSASHNLRQLRAALVKLARTVENLEGTVSRLESKVHGLER